MAETVDRITLINRALARIGAPPIGGENDDSDLAAQVMAVYDDTVEAAIGAYHWKWPLRTIACDRLVETPVNGFRYAYQLPATLGVPQGFLADPRFPEMPLRRFSRERKTVYADTETLWVRGLVYVDPAEWPPLFRAAVSIWLAAEFAVPVTHDATLAADLRQQAIGSPSEFFRGGLMGRAIAMDRSDPGADPAALLQSDYLTSARHEGAWYGDASGSWSG